jgi:WD40 repeat protein
VDQASEPHDQAQHTIKVESDNMDGILTTQAVTIPALSEHNEVEDPLHKSVLEGPVSVQPMAVDELGVGVDPDAAIPSLKAELVEDIEGDVNMNVDLSLPADPMNFQSTGKYECRLILSGHTLSISSLKFSPDGKMLASAGQSLISHSTALAHTSTKASC